MLGETTSRLGTATERIVTDSTSRISPIFSSNYEAMVFSKSAATYGLSSFTLTPNTNELS